MQGIGSGFRLLALQVLAAAALTLAACGEKQPPATPTAPDAAQGVQSQAPGAAAPAEQATPAKAGDTPAEPPQPLQASDATWKPEALEELLAPIALYPDPVLAQVLTASTNPQEVLDAGNWLVENPTLEGKALDQAAEKVGFTPPVRALIQFPDVIDMMCMQMDWTEELGQAFVNDQAGVMDAVQRLRAQAKDVGTLKSSEQMKVATEKKDGKETITVSPPSPQVVYVPQYDPVAAYVPPAAAPAPEPAATAPATTQTQDNGHSTGSLIATGLLAFGAGMVVNEIFDHDEDDYWHGGYSTMWYRPMPYYPPYPYRPVYGGGFYPGNAYNRPNNYVRNNRVVVVNQNNNYWNRYDNTKVERNRVAPRSPITVARTNRPELQQLNAQAAAGPRRSGPSSSDAWKGKSSYLGASPDKRGAIEARTSSAESATTRKPKLQGAYAGAGQSAALTKAQAGDVRAKAGEAGSARPAASPARPAAGPRDIQRPAASSTADHGQIADAAADKAASASGRPSSSRPMATRDSSSGERAFSGASHGGAERVASQRGRASMPAGGAQKARAAGRGRRG